MQFEKSADTKIIEQVLREASPGETITYERISKALGRDVRKFAISGLGSARRSLLNDGIVFAVESKVGLVRLDDSKIVDSTVHDRKKMERAAKRSIRKLSVVDFEKLTEDKKREHVASSAALGAIALFSGNKAVKKIEEKVNGNTSVIPIGETLKLFH